MMTWQVFLILREMVFDTVPVLLYMALAALTTGLVFTLTVIHPPSGVDPPQDRQFTPLFAGFWAIIGDYEYMEAFHDESLPSRKQFQWLPILLYLQAFLCVIFLVNLMSTRTHLLGIPTPPLARA